MPARRLFDSDGQEIFRSKHIRRDEEYYVSSGENFISYEARTEVAYQRALNRVNLGQKESNSAEPISDDGKLVRQELYQKTSSHTGRSESVLVESATYV